MDEDRFWRVIAWLNWRHEGIDDQVVRPAVWELAKADDAEIVQFQEILADKLYALDGYKWARESGDEVWWGEPAALSVDGFLYSRCVVVANGRDSYYRVLNDPSEMPKDMEFEALLYLAPKAWERRTGTEWDHATRLSFETFSNQAGWRRPDYPRRLHK